MDEDGEEEHGSAVHVDIANEPPVVDVAHDTFDGVEGVVDMGGVLHGEKDSGNDHDGEHDGSDGAEAPEVVEISGHGVDDVFLMGVAEDGQARVDPAYERIFEFWFFG